MDCKSHLREETMAISVMANTPLASKRTKTKTISSTTELMDETDNGSGWERVCQFIFRDCPTNRI